MKRLILPFLAAMVLVSCEDLATNTPAMQGEVNEVFFKANGAQATKTEDDYYLIQGFNEDETMTLRIKHPPSGTFELGGGLSNYATFEDAGGNIYSTNPDGAGKVTMTKWDTSNKTLSGTFSFNATIPGVDTVYVQKGVFFEVRYADGDDSGSQGNAGTFVAEVDGSPFNPFTVTAVNTGNSIFIVAATTNVTVSIRVPVDVATGSYELPMNGFAASYADGSITENANSGNIFVITHTTNDNNIAGTFSFVTDNHTVSLGQFNVTYQ